MSRVYWDKKHDKYATQSWIDKPSIFAKEVIKYFPEKGRTYKDDIFLIRFIGKKE